MNIVQYTIWWSTIVFNPNVVWYFFTLRYNFDISHFWKGCIEGIDICYLQFATVDSFDLHTGVELGHLHRGNVWESIFGRWFSSPYGVSALSRAWLRTLVARVAFVVCVYLYRRSHLESDAWGSGRALWFLVCPDRSKLALMEHAVRMSRRARSRRRKSL